MTRQFHFLERCVGALAFAAAIATSAVASAGPVVNVADVEQLYLAVNEPSNKGAAVVLAPASTCCRPTIRRASPDLIAVVSNCRGICRFTELPATARRSSLTDRPCRHRRSQIPLKSCSGARERSGSARQQHDRMADRPGEPGGGRKHRDGAPTERARGEHEDQSRPRRLRWKLPRRRRQECGLGDGMPDGGSMPSSSTTSSSDRRRMK